MNLFDSANLACVAYAEVDGATGASTACNSGLLTTRVSTGVYHLSLPTGLGQVASKDLIVVQPKVTTAPSTPAGNVTALVNDTDTDTKVVYCGNSVTTQVDCSFSVIVLRTTVPPTTA
jgi:hypothetical protein